MEEQKGELFDMQRYGVKNMFLCLFTVMVDVVETGQAMKTRFYLRTDAASLQIPACMSHHFCSHL